MKRSIGVAAVVAAALSIGVTASIAEPQQKGTRSGYVTSTLAYWDVAGGDWVIEPITYDVYVGDSSRDTPLSATFAVTPF